jgi:hypothetical protein
MVDLHVKIASFAKKENYIFSMNSGCSELVSTRWSTVLILPFSEDSLVLGKSKLMGRLSAVDLLVLTS